MPPSLRSSRLLAASAGLALAPLTSSALAQADNPALLQWFETRWDTIEARMPDFFMAGYAGVWLPSPGKASTGSPGYDPFDRFDLGQPGSETAYGTEATFRAMVQEFHRAGALVYPEGIYNHNGARSSNANFIADGGWPGFYLPGNGPTNNPPGPAFVTGLGPFTVCGNFTTRATGNYFWGDFHNGQTQSENPGGGSYCLWLGDLVSLIDIAQESEYVVIRHPTGTDTRNIPPGRVRNRPDPANARFYPDPTLTPRAFTNPGVPGFSATTNWTFSPFNVANPSAGIAVPESVSGLLIRWTRWMIEDVGVDGFRLDAAKHVKHDFWNEKFDAAVFNARRTADGRQVTAFSFVETVDGNPQIRFYTRKDGFGNRDALDINEAGALRDLVTAGGFGRWAKDIASDPEGPIERSVDTADDAQNNGTLGVHHVFSHDNGSVGNGGSEPGLPTLRQQGLPQNAYVLARPGVALVYHNGRELGSRFPSRGFWPREGNPTALGATASGATDQWLSGLVGVRNAYARGALRIINGTDPVNSSRADVLAIERGSDVASALFLVNDSYANGTQFRSLDTTFPAGTRLMELTGTWNDTGPEGANLGGSVQRIITVDGTGRALFPVPNNRNSAGFEHARGFVAYGLPAPAGTLSIGPQTGVLPADPAPPSNPAWSRRLTPVPIVNGPSIEIALTTTRADATDPAGNANADDFACFRLNEGFRDYNGINPSNTPGGWDQPIESLTDAGFERFVTRNEPLATTPGAITGEYRQTIDASLLPEGFNYLSVIAYRRRTDGGLPVYRDFRSVFYVDRLPPQVSLASPEVDRFPFAARVVSADRCTTEVYVITNVPEGVDPRSQPGTYLTAANRATRHDRFEWRRSISTLPQGTSTLTIVAFELSGNSLVSRVSVTNAVGSGDVNRDGLVNLHDLYAAIGLGATYQAEADMNRNGSVDAVDRRILEAIVRANEVGQMRRPRR